MLLYSINCKYFIKIIKITRLFDFYWFTIRVKKRPSNKLTYPKEKSYEKQLAFLYLFRISNMILYEATS